MTQELNAVPAPHQAATESLRHPGRACKPAFRLSPEAAARRRNAIQLVQQGRSMNSVARQFHCTSSDVWQWKQRHEKWGDAAYLACGCHDPRLSPLQMTDLRIQLARGARWHAYDTEDWTLYRVAELIEHAYGVRYKEGGVRAMLVRNGIPWRNLYQLAKEAEKLAKGPPLRDEAACRE